MDSQVSPWKIRSGKTFQLHSILKIHPALYLATALAASAQDLPSVLGTPPAATPAEWMSKQRPATLELFKENIYGRNPVDRPEALSFKVTDEDRDAMDGAATRKLVDVRYSGPGGEGKMELILFIPNKAQKPAPGFLLICNQPPENIDPSRVVKSPFWSAEEIVARGYVAAVFHYSDVDPDNHDGFKNGVHGTFDPKDKERAPDAWGSIAAWAWGASRAMDYFETDDAIDHTKMAVVGHSRGGKASLWAGATDERFAMVISNNSGCSGAALSRRKQGERVADINRNFPHWFNENYKNFNGKEETLPIDQHQLIALIAPRPVYIASAKEDDWADPEGEFLAGVHAAPVYKLFGLTGLGTEEVPEADNPIATGHIGYHIRTGKHDLTLYDWERYMDFADLHFNSGN